MIIMTLSMLLALSVISISASAQINDPGDDPDAPSVPIDGLSGITLTIGGLYILKKAKSRKTLKGRINKS